MDGSCEFGAAVAAQLGHPLAAHEERTFEDGEHKIRPLVDPDGMDVFVVQSLHGGPSASGDDKLVRLLLFIAALRDHGARRITAVRRTSRTRARTGAPSPSIRFLCVSSRNCSRQPAATG